MRSHNISNISKQADAMKLLLNTIACKWGSIDRVYTRIPILRKSFRLKLKGYVLSLIKINYGTSLIQGFQN